MSEALGPLAAKNATYASSKEIWQYISQLGISKVMSLCQSYTHFSAICFSSQVFTCMF